MNELALYELARERMRELRAARESTRLAETLRSKRARAGKWRIGLSWRESGEAVCCA
jgi:hypothetical protein